MTNNDKQLSRRVVDRPLSPAFTAFEAITAGEIQKSQLETLTMTMSLARLAGQHGVRTPAVNVSSLSNNDDFFLRRVEGLLPKPPENNLCLAQHRG